MIWDISFCGYGEGTHAIGAGDDVVPRYPNRRFVSLDCRTRWSFTEQLCNLCLQFLELKWFGKEGIGEYAKRLDRRMEFSAYGNRWDLRESPAHDGEKLEA